MILSAIGSAQLGPRNEITTPVRHRLALCIARAALDETQTIDRIWASFTHPTSRPARSRRHKKFVAEHLAFFFSVAEGFLRQCLPKTNDNFLEELADDTCRYALADASIPKPYQFVGELPAKRYDAYRNAVMTRRVELWRVHPYATTGALADMTVERLIDAAAMPKSMEGHVANVLRARLEWAGSELIGRA